MILDNNTQQAVPLNEFFKGNLNNYKAGEIRYPLENLSVGKHTLTLRAWDNYNNSAEASVEFLVESSENLVLKNVLNYPNPFTNKTTFHFDHNKAGRPMKVRIQVFTISGKLVKTMLGEYATSNSHFSELEWNGLDDFGDKIGKGVYIYKVSVKVEGETTTEATQKLVILN